MSYKFTPLETVSYYESEPRVYFITEEMVLQGYFVLGLKETEKRVGRTTLS